MYPYLDEFAVRGSPERGFFLQNYKSGEEFILTSDQADVLRYCNGSLSENELSHIHNVSSDALHKFLDYFHNAGILEYAQNTPTTTLPIPELKDPYLQELQLEVTGNCNLWCKHCYGREYFKDIQADRLDLTAIQKLIDDMVSANVARCFLTGGEAFTRKDLPEIIKMLAKAHIHIGGIFTNGTIWRQDILDALKEADTMTQFLISVDGHNTHTHDFIRGDGTFGKTIHFIKRVINSGFRVVVNTVVMKPNVQHLPKLQTLLEEIGVSSWRVSVPREQGEALANRDAIESTWPEVFSAYKELLIPALEQSSTMQIQLSSIFRSGFASTGKYYLYRDDSGACQYKRWGSVVSSDGNLLPCPAGMDLSSGNIKTESLSKLWESPKSQAFKTIPISNIACNRCDIREYCGSGCRVNAKRLSGSYHGTDHTACHLYRFFVNDVKPILESYGISPELIDAMPDYGYPQKSLDVMFP